MHPRRATPDKATCPVCASKRVEATRLGDVGLSRHGEDCGAAFDVTGGRIAFTDGRRT